MSSFDMEIILIYINLNKFLTIEHGDVWIKTDFNRQTIQNKYNWYFFFYIFITNITYTL